MTIFCLLLRSVRRYSTTTTATFQTPVFTTSNQTLNHHLDTQSPSQSSSAAYTNPYQSPISTTSNTTTNILNYQFESTSSSSTPVRSYGFSSAEEAAAERRRRKRRVRIEPPLYALRSNPAPPKPNDPNKPRLPDSTSSLVGSRLNLHNRVQSLIRAGDLDSASYIARQSVFQSPRPTVFTCNAIIAAMYRAKRYEYAKGLFQYFFKQFDVIPNIVSYNNLIGCHCESNDTEEALNVYNHILENAPYAPSPVTYQHLTKGLIEAGRINDAVSLLREMLHKGHAADSLVYNNLILGYLNLGNLEKANELFDELKERCSVYDGAVNATFMDWFFKQGRPKEAMESYRDLMDRNYRMVPAQRNVLLETLLRHGRKKEAWSLFDDMLDDHTPPSFLAVNSDTFNMMVNECFKDGNVAEAKEVFKRVGKAEKSKPFLMDVAGYNNIMTRLCELGMIDEADEYYRQVSTKSMSLSVNTYKIMIDAYMKVDRIEEMLDKYTKLVESGFRVIPAYANEWFEFLIEKGRVLDCLPILSKMGNKEPRPDFTTYNVVIRGLINGGNYDAAVNLLSEMMGYGVDTTVALEEFVLDVFEKQGRRMEVENNFNRKSNPFQPWRPNPGSRGSPQTMGPPQMPEQGKWNPSMQWQTNPGSRGSPQTMGPPQMPEQGKWNPSMQWQKNFPANT